MTETPVMRMCPEMALQYLDNNIYHWRMVLRGADLETEGHVIVQASDYIDAYQSVRVALFGELKPLEEWQR